MKKIKGNFRYFPLISLLRIFKIFSVCSRPLKQATRRKYKRFERTFCKNRYISRPLYFALKIVFFGA